MLKADQIKKLQPFIALIVLCAVFAVLSDKFLTTSNGWNVMRQVAVNICISVGMTLVILTGGIDLSVGSILAFAGALAAGLLKNGIELTSQNTFIGFTLLGGILICLLVGAMIGLFNGWIITRFKVPPFVATLAMLTIARGMTMLYTHGYPINNLGSKFDFIGTGWFLGVPLPVWICLFVSLIAIFITRRMSLGVYIYALGDNENASRLSGISVSKIKMMVYTLSGTLAALGGLMVTARLDSAQPNAGLSYELDAIAAVVIGGTSLSGGKGSVLGTLLGALTIGVLNNGLVLLNVSPFWQQVIKGVVILLAVIIDKASSQDE